MYIFDLNIDEIILKGILQIKGFHLRLRTAIFLFLCGVFIGGVFIVTTVDLSIYLKGDTYEDEVSS
jgi:hypothetical protein